MTSQVGVRATAFAAYEANNTRTLAFDANTEVI